MDGKRFDAITRGLTVGTSRRRMLAGVLGSIVTVQTGAAAFAAKNRNRKDGDQGRGAEESDVAPGTLVGGVFEESIEVCHFDLESGGYEVLTVSPLSLADYLNQGDSLYFNCCVDSECGVLPCFSSAGCTEGACAYSPTAGAPCAVDDGTTGACDKDGVCVSVAVAAPVGVG